MGRLLTTLHSDRSYMRILLSVALALCAFCANLPHGAAAQTIPSPYRFIEGSHDGGIVLGIMQDRRGELGIGPGGGALFGGRYAIELTGPLAAELTGWAMPTERTVVETNPGEGLVPLGEADLLLLAVDARLRFTLTGPRSWQGLAPFVTAGAGIVGRLAPASPLEVDIPLTHRVDFGPSALLVGSVGTRWIPWDRLTFRAEGALHFWRVGTPIGFVDVEEDLESLPDNDWVGVGGILLGVSYRF